MGRHAVLHFLLPAHIPAGVPERAVHPAPPSRLEDRVRHERAVPAGAAVPAIPKLQDCPGHFRVARSEVATLSHRHGQRLRRELLGRVFGARVEPRGRVRFGALLGLDVQGDTDPTLGDSVGDQRDVGNNRSSFRALAAQLQGVLVGCSHFRRANLQRVRDMVRAAHL